MKAMTIFTAVLLSSIVAKADLKCSIDSWPIVTELNAISLSDSNPSYVVQINGTTYSIYAGHSSSSGYLVSAAIEDEARKIDAGAQGYLSARGQLFNLRAQVDGKPMFISCEVGK